MISSWPSGRCVACVRPQQGSRDLARWPPHHRSLSLLCPPSTSLLLLRPGRTPLRPAPNPSGMLRFCSHPLYRHPHIRAHPFLRPDPLTNSSYTTWWSTPSLRRRCCTQSSKT